MGNVQVTATPQAIYPDGLQDSFVITNNGPFTIYVDSDASISTRSLAVPPTGSIAWDANRPLWMVLSGVAPLGFSIGATQQTSTSSVSITRNGHVPAFINSQDIELARVSAVAGANGVETQMFEATAFKSIIVNLNSALMEYTVPDALQFGKTYKVTVRWYNPTGLFLSQDNYYVHGYFNAGTSYPFQNASTRGPRLVVPVKAQYFSIVVAPGTGTIGGSINIVVTGSTIERAQESYSGAFRSDVYCASSLVPLAMVEDSILLDFGTPGSTGGGSWNNSILSIALPNLSTTLQVTLTQRLGTATNAGLLTFVTLAESNARVVTDVTLVAAAVEQTFTFRIPLGTAIVMLLGLPTTAGNITVPYSVLNLTWL